PEVEASISAALTELNIADEVLSKKEGSSWITFTVAAGIFLREAFEAALILITLLGIIRSIGSKKAALFVHLGWILAVLCGIAAWFFSGWLMLVSGARRELLEGGISLLAVFVLLYFGFWLHRKAEIGKWNAFIKDLVKSATENGKLIGLG